MMMALSLLSDIGYLKEEDKMMDTDDDVTLEEELIEMEENMEVNPDHNLNDRENVVEQENKTCNQRDQRTETTQGHTTTKTPTLPAKKRIKKTQTAIESLKKHSDNWTCPASFQYRGRPNVKMDKNSKLMLNASANKWKKILFIFSLASKVN